MKTKRWHANDATVPKGLLHRERRGRAVLDPHAAVRRNAHRYGVAAHISITHGGWALTSARVADDDPWDVAELEAVFGHWWPSTTPAQRQHELRLRRRIKPSN